MRVAKVRVGILRVEVAECEPNMRDRRLADGIVHCAASATYEICFRLPNPNPITDPNPNRKIN